MVTFTVFVTFKVSKPGRCHQDRQSKLWKVGGNVFYLFLSNYQFVIILFLFRFSVAICNDEGRTDLSVNCLSPNSLQVMRER